MLASLYVNFFNRRARIDGELWSPEKERVYRLLEDTIRKKLYDREKMRAHLEDVVGRLMERPEAVERIEEEMGPQPVVILALTDVQILFLQALYMEYLDDEEVILFAAMVI